MNKNMLIGIIILVIIIIGLIIFIKNSQKTEKIKKVNEIEDTKKVESSVISDGVFSLSKEESQIEWQGKKTLLKEWIDSGNIALSSGEVMIKEGSIASGNIVIDMNSITTTKTGMNSGEDKLSVHLKSKDFFDVDVYPTSEFKITAVENSKITGDITIKNTTKSIEFPVISYMENNNLVVEGEIIINRADFDVRYGSQNFFNDLGDNVIDNNFTLKVKLVGVKQ